MNFSENANNASAVRELHLSFESLEVIEVAASLWLERHCPAALVHQPVTRFIEPPVPFFAFTEKTVSENAD